VYYASPRRHHYGWYARSRPVVQFRF
jgi:hypothetical protein